MLEFLQWLALIILTGLVVWLLKERRKEIPRWLEDLTPEDLLNRSELDQYHHRLLSLTQTQREYFSQVLNNLEERIGILEGRQPGEVGAILSMSNESSSIHAPAAGSPSGDTARLSVESEVFQAAEITPTPTSLPSAEIDPLPDSGLDDATRQALTLWKEGKTIDQIAQQLRMGRQEAQLLIRMSRLKPVFPKGA